MLILGNAHEWGFGIDRILGRATLDSEVVLGVACVGPLILWVIELLARHAVRRIARKGDSLGGLMCVQCGYDLRMLERDQHCPECGFEFRAVETKQAWRLLATGK